jgi:Flp pilus assembly protein TadD
MLFHVFMTLYALVRWNPSRWVQIGYALALVLQVSMIFYAATRGTTLGLLGGLLLAGLIFTLFNKKGESESKTLRRGGIALIVGILVIVGGFFAIKDTPLVQNSDVLSRFASINLEEGQTRFTIWNMALQGAMERPLFGWGQENFNYVFNKYYQASMYAQEPWFDRAHNQFLDWLIAGGIVGFVLYIALYAFALWYLWRGDTFDIKERAVLTGLLAAYAFHNLFVFDNLMSSVLFMGLLAYITVRHTSEKPEISLPAMPSATLSMVSGVVVVALIAVFYFANVPGMTRASTMVNALQPHTDGLQGNFDFFKEAVKGNQVGRQEAHEQLLQFATQIRRADLQALSTEELRNEVANFAYSAFAEEIARTPNDARVRMFYGSFLRQSGDLDGAQEHLTRALELSPEKQAIMFELGLVATMKNDGAEAVSWFQKAHELEPKYDQARMLYISILIRVGNQAAADVLLQERFETVTPPNEVLMQAYYDTSNFARAVLVAEARVAENPSDINRYAQLAGMYLGAGQRAAAIAALRTAIELDPGFKAQGEQFISQIQNGEI